MIEIPPLGAPTGILGTRRHVVALDQRLRPAGSRPGLGRSVPLGGARYDGPLPEGGFFVRRSRTSRLALFGRRSGRRRSRCRPSKPPSGVRIQLFVPGGAGSAVASFLAGVAPHRVPGQCRPASSSARAGRLNTMTPTDYSLWVMRERPRPATSPRAPAIPRSRASWRRSASSRASRSSRTRGCGRSSRRPSSSATPRPHRPFAPRPEEGFAYYPGSHWTSSLFVGGYDFMDPPPRDHGRRPRAAPSDGARKLNSRTTSSTWPPGSRRPCACA